MVSLAMETLTNADLGIGDWGIAVTGLIMLLFGGMWILGLWKVECFQWGLMGHPSRNMEDSDAGRDLNCGSLCRGFRRILECDLETVFVIF